MDELFRRQRIGYTLGLDILIKEAKPDELDLRCKAFLKLEDDSEQEYRNTTLLKQMYQEGLGYYREQVLLDLNKDLKPLLQKSYPNDYIDIQKTFRDREDKILGYALEFMSSWEPDIPRRAPNRNKAIEERHRKNMIYREISSRGLGKKGILIQAPLARELRSNFPDNSTEYDEMYRFSMEFIERFGDELGRDQYDYIMLAENTQSKRHAGPQ